MRSTALIFLSALLCIPILSATSAASRRFNITYSLDLAPDPAKIDRARDLKLWLPIPRDWDTQKVLKISVDPPPHARYEDPEHGNPILFWDFGKEPEKASYKVELKLRLEVIAVEEHGVPPEIDPKQVGTYDRTSDEYRLYTRSTHSICITPKIRDLALEAVGDEKNPYLQADRIVRFVMKKVRYKVLDPVRGRGMKVMLENPVKDKETGEEYYEGHCLQRSELIVACCRAIGIPARSINGYVGWSPWVKEEDLPSLSDYLRRFMPEPELLSEVEPWRKALAGTKNHGHMWPHTWTEFYIPNHGWIPVDGREVKPLDSKRVIFTKGLDIKIGPHCPQEDSNGYGCRKVLLNDGRMDVPQPGVWNIARSGNTKVKVLITLDPFPGDAVDATGLHYREDYSEEAVQGFRLWRIDMLSWISYFTRVCPDRETALEKVYNYGPFGNEWPTLRYEKDAYFVCHMLHKIVGNDKSLQIFREYENLRINSGEPVSTERFQKLAEDIYGHPLDWFFDQWLQAKVLPEFRLDRVIVSKGSEGWQVRGHLLQVGDIPFRTPIELALETEKRIERLKIWVEDRDSELEFRTSSRPTQLMVDPDMDVLKIQRMPLCLGWLQAAWFIEPNFTSIYGTAAEADANKATAERFINEHLIYFVPWIDFKSGRNVIKADTDVTEDDLRASVVFLFGRPATNRIARRFEDMFPVKFNGDMFTWQGITYDQPTQGVCQGIYNPLNPKGLLILYAGLSGEATLQNCDLLAGKGYGRRSYVIFDGQEQLVRGYWEIDSNLVWKFGADRE